MLSSFQERIIRIFFSVPGSENFALGGGAALAFHRVIQRETEDVDFFGEVGELVTGVAEVFKRNLEQAAMTYEVLVSHPTFVRLAVGSASEKLKVDIGQDYHLYPPERTPLGLVRTLEELAADKVLALFARAEARDFVDLYDLARQFPLDKMIGWAREKDPGFDPYVFAKMIGQLHRFPDADLLLSGHDLHAMKEFYRKLQADLVKDTLGE